MASLPHGTVPTLGILHVLFSPVDGYDNPFFFDRNRVFTIGVEPYKSFFPLFPLTDFERLDFLFQHFFWSWGGEPGVKYCKTFPPFFLSHLAFTGFHQPGVHNPCSLINFPLPFKPQLVTNSRLCVKLSPGRGSFISPSRGCFTRENLSALVYVQKLQPSCPVPVKGVLMIHSNYFQSLPLNGGSRRIRPHFCLSPSLRLAASPRLFFSITKVSCQLIAEKAVFGVWLDASIR